MALPFLKWAGGKRQMLPELRKHVPESFREYYEPFLGGGALFFDLSLQDRVGQAWLSDTNNELVMTYRAVRNSPEQLISQLKGLVSVEEEYYKTRAINPGDLNEEEDVATWLIYLNRTCFNGLYRVNKAGRFNTPFGKYTNPKICDAENLRAASNALDWATVERLSFEKSMQRAQKDDFIYCDPPYVPTKTTSFTAYEKSGFGTAEQTALRDSAAAARDRGSHVLLSNSDTPLVRELYQDGFELFEVQGRRNVNGKGDGRGKVSELIIVGKTS